MAVAAVVIVVAAAAAVTVVLVVVAAAVRVEARLFSPINHSKVPFSDWHLVCLFVCLIVDLFISS